MIGARLRRGSRGMAILLLATSMASGCSRWESDFPFVSTDTRFLGTKMLKPGARATICRFQWMGRESKPSAVDDAVRSLRERDAEADALLNLHVEVEGWSLGIVSRLCATAVADVVRATPVAILPMPGGMDHTGHHE